MCFFRIMSENLTLGQPAPLFTAPVIGGEYQEETTLSLADLQGETVVLVFYPKDNTPGCTTQGCEMRDDWSELSQQAKIFGVSIDSIKSHQKFIDKQELPYPLIADEDKAIVEAYGVWVEKSMYGKTFMGTERTTFIIDPEGNLKTILKKVQPKKHLTLLKEALES